MLVCIQLDKITCSFRSVTSDPFEDLNSQKQLVKNLETFSCFLEDAAGADAGTF